MVDQVYANAVRRVLVTSIDALNANKQYYVQNPEKDFQRERKIPFDTMVNILLQMENRSLQTELLNYYNHDPDVPTKSAFCQQRKKLRAEAMAALFSSFTKEMISLDTPKTTKEGYLVLACDGSDINIPYNPDDTETYHQNANKRGYSSLERLNFRLMWEQALRRYLGSLQKPSILCGDFNVAYSQLDVYGGNDRIKTNPYLFTDEDREGFRRLLELGYMAFREVDAAVQALLIERIRQRHPRWCDEAILRNYFIKDGEYHAFKLPDDASVRVERLATIPIVKHKPCKLNFNPYLDSEYYLWLQHRRDVMKTTGRYRAVWNRQDGKCAYCGQPMLADQEVDLIEQTIGNGWSLRNLAYIHRRCAYDVFDAADEERCGSLDVETMLRELLEEKRHGRSPYLKLREYFRLCEQSPLLLTFAQIEHILGCRLDWEAYFYTAFWYDDLPNGQTLLWQQEGYPFHKLQLTTPDYCISEAWLTQGYVIKSLHLNERYVVFQKTAQRVSGLKIPDKLLKTKLPDRAVQLADEFFAWLIREFGI